MVDVVVVVGLGSSMSRFGPRCDPNVALADPLRVSSGHINFSKLGHFSHTKPQLGRLKCTCWPPAAGVGCCQQQQAANRCIPAAAEGRN